MSYQGHIENGVVVFDGKAPLPDGTPVEVIPLDSTDRKATGLPGFGLWRDRSDWPKSGEASLLLRGRAAQRGEDG